MIIRINEFDAKKAAIAADRDYYSLEAWEAILDYYDEFDENAEFDLVAICCDWTEYGDNEHLSYDRLVQDYNSCYSFEEFCEDEYDTDDTDDEERRVAYLDALIDYIEYRTTVIRLSHSVLIAAF